MRRTIAISMLIATAAPAFADSDQLALNLATLIAAENFCDLTFDQDAIGAWIDKHVAADDMVFARRFRLFVSGKQSEQKSIGAAEKAAYCRQVERSAKANGFIK